jgi:hypothetical protein
VNLDIRAFSITRAARASARPLHSSTLQSKVGGVVASQRAAACRTDSGVRAGRAGRVAAVGGEDAGEELVHQWAQEGEAGADYAHVYFNGGPGCGGGVVVALVCAVGDGDEGVQAQDGDDADAV